MPEPPPYDGAPAKQAAAAKVQAADDLPF
jgi:hypothetical protein